MVFYAIKKIEDFSEKINILIENKNLRFEFSKNAVKSIEQYSPDVINKKWLTVIENILDKHDFDNEIVANNKSKYKLFDLNEVFAVKELSFKAYLFSIKPSLDGRHKIIRILGLKFKKKYKKKV